MDTSPLANASSGTTGFVRRPEVVVELSAAGDVPVDDWVDQAHQWKKETLCTLARRLLAWGYDDLFQQLVDQQIYPRAIKIANSKCMGLAEIDAQEVVDRTLHAINEDLIHADLSRLRYCEISFGHFVSRRALTAAARLRKLRAKEVVVGEDLDEVPISNAQAMLEMKRAMELSENLRMALQKVLPTLKDEQRVAFEYWYSDGYPIESSDPDVISIEKLVHRNKRTVHYWFEKIFAALKAEIGERT